MATIIDFTEKRFTQTQPEQDTKPLPGKNYLLDYRAWIDNLSELAIQLGFDTANYQSISLTSLLLLAFERWNVGMFRHLRGDWWLAIWDASKQSVILAIDPGSPTTLFYAWTTAGQFAFSPSLTDILAIESIPQDLHEARVVSYLIQWNRYHDFLQTEYKAVRQIGTATFNVFSKKKVHTEAYWQTNQFQIKKVIRPEEYVEEFLRRYRQAILYRFPSAGSVASMLSAGLDSGSVTALAASMLENDNRQIYAYTHIPVQEAKSLYIPGKIINEWPAASQLAAMYPNIKHVAVQSDHINPISAAIFMLQATGRMQAANVNATWIHQLYQSVKRDGFDTLLGGQAGNIFSSWSGGKINIWNLFFMNEWRQAFSYLQNRKQKSWPSMLKLLAGDMIRYINPALDFPPVHFTPQLTAIANPDLCQRWRDDFEENAKLHSGSITNHRQYRDHAFPMLATAHSFGQSISGAYGITLNDPTCDQHVIEWCLQIPDTGYLSPTQNRLLIRNAMQGIIPEWTRNTQLRGLQPADLGYRYNKYRESIDCVMNLMESSPMVNHYLNMKAIKRAWLDVKNRSQPSEDLFYFHRGLQAGLFFLVREGKLSDHALR